MRTSDRVYLEVPIIISGTDNAGQEFEENTQTLVVSRRGAKIISRHTLVPQQKLMLRSLMTGLDAELRVIGPILGDEEGCHFGVEILHPELNVWGINFPLLDGTENPAGRVFLACANCHAQEVVHLDVFELEVLLANECLTRPCKQCNHTTLWTRSAAGEERIPVGRVAPDSRLPPYDSGTEGASHKPQGQCLSPSLRAWRRGSLYGKHLAGWFSLQRPQGLSHWHRHGSCTCRIHPEQPTSSLP